jgi:hypothetical protein
MGILFLHLTEVKKLAVGYPPRSTGSGIAPQVQDPQDPETTF